MLLFSIGELQVLREAWRAYGDGSSSSDGAAATMADKLDGGRGPKAYTRGEAALLAPAIGAWLDSLPKNVEGGVMLGRSELEFVRKLLTAAAGRAT